MGRQFSSNSLFPSLIPTTNIQTQPHKTTFLLPSTACLLTGDFFLNGGPEAGFAVNEKSCVHLHGCIITLYRDLSDAESGERGRKVGRHKRELKARSLDEMKE